MEEAARVRGGAHEAVADIVPDRLRGVIDDRLAVGSMIPGVLTVLSGRLVDPGAEQAIVDRRAAGVQLIYEGLRLTRSLVHEDPWAEAGLATDMQADVDVLAADVLVARGFRLLARTEAAEVAVSTVQAFGREQTDLLADRDPPARTLETNVFELAVVAGSTVNGGDTPLALRQYAIGLARARGAPPLPIAAEGLPERIEDVLARVGEPAVADAASPRSPDWANPKPV
jgi:hypothetical protein